jgi:hypothetical protein
MWYDRDSGIVQVTVTFLCGGLLEKFQIIMRIVVTEGVYGLHWASLLARW